MVRLKDVDRYDMRDKYMGAEDIRERLTIKDVTGNLVGERMEPLELG